MIYYELVLTVKLVTETSYLSSQAMISQNINQSMALDEELRGLHERSGYKNYVFCNFYPTEKDKVYKRDNIYLFNMRSLDLQFLLKLKHLLSKTSSDFKVLAAEIRTYSPKFIEEISNITPALSTMEGGRYWTKENGIDILMDRMHANAVKKAKDYLGNAFIEPKENFIQSLEQLNHKDIRLAYKKSSLIGSRFTVGVKSDEVSQKLARIILGTGMLEKNSLGLGYCVFK